MSNILTCAISKTSLQRKRYLRGGKGGREGMEERREGGREGWMNWGSQTRCTNMRTSLRIH